MGCKHPLKAWRSRSGPDKKTGHWPLVFDVKKGIAKKEVLVPCGKCIACRLERVRQWAMRSMAEASMHDFNCFITLTYNFENAERKLKIRSNVTGESIYSLNKREFQLFMKRLRKDLWKNEHIKIKFYHCGEYGERFERPHHHAIIYGWWPPDCVPWKHGKNNRLFRSEIIDNLWGNGYAIVGEVTFESAAYVAGYIVKKVFGEMADVWYEGRQPEYTSCSNRVAIAKEWYNKFKSDLEGDCMMIRPGKFTRPPKYFDKLLEKEEPEELLKRKEERTKKAIENLKTRKQRIEEERIMKSKLKTKLHRRYENG